MQQADGEEPEADAASGRPRPPRLMTPPTTAMPISEPRKNEVKTQP